MAIIFIGQLGTRTVYLLEARNAIRSEVPVDVLVVGIALVMYAIVMFGFGILDPIPLTRQTAIAQMREGLVVPDRQGRVVSLNPAAACG